MVESFAAQEVAMVLNARYAKHVTQVEKKPFIRKKHNTQSLLNILNSKG